MNRISRQQMFMGFCDWAAMRSTCMRGNVGALIVKDNDVVSVGYNGPPSGHDHCQGDTCQLTPEGGCLRSIHAEKNAIARALTKLRVSELEGHHLYCTWSPCAECAKLIFNSYIPRLYYRNTYRLPDGLDFLLKNSRSFQAFKVTPAGFLISARTGKIVDPEDIR